MRNFFDLMVTFQEAKFFGFGRAWDKRDKHVDCEMFSDGKVSDDKTHGKTGHEKHDKTKKHETKDGCDLNETAPPPRPTNEQPVEATPQDPNLLIIGRDPDELIVGQGGNDELYGGRGNDVIVGGEGNDFLSGNYGDDILVGGIGRDTFCFDGNFDTETVADFSIRDGDHMRFILYTPEQADLTDADLLSLFVQEGANAVLTLEGTDERVVLHNVDVADLTEEMISVTIIPPVQDFLV